MRFHFFWDQPFSTAVAFINELYETFTALAFALTLAILARRRVRRGAAASRIESSVDGARFAAEILKAGAITGWTIVIAKGPLANFADPARRELRLSERVAGGRTLEDLAIAAHLAGQALNDSRNPWLCRARVPLILGSKLAVDTAWLTLLAGVLMISPALTDRGSMLYALVMVALLVEQFLFENEANRLAIDALRETGGDASWTDLERQAFANALNATRWVEMAATLPLPWSPLSPPRTGASSALTPASSATRGK